MKTYWFRALVAVVAFNVFLAIAQPAVAEPALWVVKGPHATVYLFGSIHLLKKEQQWRSAKLEKAIQESQRLYLEVVDDDNQAAVSSALFQYGIDATHRLSGKLDAGHLAKLDIYARESGFPKGELSLEPFRPWFAGVTLTVATITRAGFDPASGVDVALKTQFTGAGKPVLGFETVGEQFKYFADLPDADQVDFLNSAIDDFEDTSKLKELVAAWETGDDIRLDALDSGEFRTAFPALYDTLVVHRNHNFADRIDHLLRGDGTSLVTIGAGHLVGNEGVPELLRKLGYTVSRQ